MMERRNTFGKEEHLCGKTAIDELYNTGERFFLYPFRILYKRVPKESVPVRCLVNAPKRRFKHAVDRNRLKRLMREAYRKNKHALFEMMEKEDATMQVAITYNGDTIESQAFVEKRMRKVLEQIIQGKDGTNPGQRRQGAERS